MEMIIGLAGAPISIRLAHEGWADLFAPFAAQGEPIASVAVSAAQIRAAAPQYESGSAAGYIEHMELCINASDALLPHGRAIFHGVAFIWRGRAWIITGQSGAGKTTQYIQWKRLYGSHIAIINGDKPALDFSGERVWVHPSPWRGKENMGSMLSAPLGGIIMLVRGAENSMRRLNVHDCAAGIFSQFMISCSNTEQVKLVCALEEKMLAGVPVWLLSSKGDAACARLCHDTLEKEMPLP